MRYDKTMTTATILSALLAATPFTVGAQSKTEEAKDKTKTMTQDAKTAATDTWITSKTKIALFADERVKGTQVNVDTMKGGVVHLRGKVDSAEAKSAAGEIAKGIEGVQSVKNDLQVVAPPDRKMVDKDGHRWQRPASRRAAQEGGRARGRGRGHADRRGAEHHGGGQGFRGRAWRRGREVGQERADCSPGR
jgi:hypothetical protein